MLKYHKEVYFPIKYHSKLINFNNELKEYTFKFSNHTKQRVIEKINNFEYFNIFISNLKLNSTNIIEYTVNNNEIEKVLYRFKYNENEEIILSISQNKTIITIYLNNINDKHFTLNKKIYCQS